MTSTQDYFDAAFGLLSEQGYGALKQAPLCRRIGVTTGSFYHYFKNWHDFTTQFLDHWLTASTTQLVAMAQQRDDPVEQLEALLQFTLALPHRAEAAIRVWSQVNPEVREVQEAADRLRTQVVLEAAQTVFDNDDEAMRYAQWGMYILVGYQQLHADTDTGPLEWSLRKLLQDIVVHRHDPTSTTA